MAKTIEELRETAPIIEVDDYAAGFMMASDVASCYPELKAHYLAQWAARLREHYVKIGAASVAHKPPGHENDGQY